MKKDFSVAMASSMHTTLTMHLLQNHGAEDLCFALWNPSEGTTRSSALLFDVILPGPVDRNLHGNASFNPCYFERVLRIAAEKRAGIAFLHSHLTPGWQAMSNDDFAAEAKMSASVHALTGLPLVGLTVGTDGAWSARRWSKIEKRKYSPQWARTVRVAGIGLKVTFNDDLLPTFGTPEDLVRTVSAWGEAAQDDLSRLVVCVGGVGSVGSIVAETLAMIGVRKIILIDFDELKRINRDRTVGAYRHRIGMAKVAAIAEHLREVATAPDFEVVELEYSVIEPFGLRAALDCDVIFSCVDRPWPRSVLNGIALAHLIPVIDGGIKVRTGRTGKLRSADWRAHTVAPGRRCMECLGQFSPSDVSLEREGLLDDPKYIESLLAAGSDLLRSENVIAFSKHVASMETMQFLALAVSPSGVSDIGAHHYHFVEGKASRTFESCDERCPYAAMEAQGDHSPIKLEAAHPAAERSREARRKRLNKPKLQGRFVKLWRRIADACRQKFSTSKP